MFSSGQEFLEKFRIGDNSDYFNPIILTDVKYGFSVKRKYPDTIAYKPAVNASGESVDVAAIWVVLREEIKSKDGKFLVTARISTYSPWQSTFFDPDEDDPSVPTKESIELSKKSQMPLPLEFYEDYYYDDVSCNFTNKDGKTIDAIYILDSAFKQHCETIHPLKGVELKLKLFFVRSGINTLSVLADILKFLIEKIFQRKVIYKDLISERLHGYSDIQTMIEKPFKIFEYECASSTVKIFCALVLLISVSKFYGFYDYEYLGYIRQDNFLIMTHSILALAMIEVFPNLTLFPLLNLVVKFRKELSFMPINPFSIKNIMMPVLYVASIAGVIFYLGRMANIL